MAIDYKVLPPGEVCVVPLLAMQRVTFAPEVIGRYVGQATPRFLHQRQGRRVHFTRCRNVAERL